MYFKDGQHQEKLFSLLEKYNKADSKEYSAAYYILTSDNELRRKAAAYISSDGIDFMLMLEHEDFSSGYRNMIDAAMSLFNSGAKVNLPDLCWLDEDNFNVILEAINIRRYGIEGLV